MSEMTVGAAVYVQLLGSPRAQVGEREILFAPDKRYQLLAYLAYQSDWVSREKVAFLFWPDTDSQNAKQNLRGLLQRVRALEWLSGLEADAHQLRWHAKSDVIAFRAALEQDKLERVLSLYTGSLLVGLEHDETPEFSDWLEVTRERLKTSWRGALFRRVEELQVSTRHNEATELLGRLLYEDPLDEEALRAFMQTSAAAGQGQKRAALKAYEGFAERLKAELGLEPTSVTEQLKKVLEKELLAPTPSLSAPTLEPVFASVEAPPHAVPAVGTVSPPLPTPTTSFVGRSFELTEAAHLLSKLDCRLLTLVGGGGSGKTRLAIEIAHVLKDGYTDGAHFVSLASLGSPHLLMAGIASSFGLQQDQEELLDKVTRYLQRKQLLLILDNFEHLLDGTELLADLLQNCPNLKLLVTSRERLNLEEEWLLPIEGLSYPQQGTLLEQASRYEAVQLFVQRAQRVLPRFSLNEDDLQHILKLCELVQGFPLGIELTVAWVRALPVKEISREVERNLDFLCSSARNVPDRHRSIRAVFQHTWNLLAAKEQSASRGLSVFRGGFKREAAAIVAGASIAMIAALVDKSLLRVSVTGRYDRHPLLHQYLQEKLAEDPEAWRVKERHVSYFFALAEDAEPHLVRAQQAAYLGQLEAEHDNLRAALQWLLDSHEVERALRLANLLGQFWYSRGHLQEGQDWLEKGLASEGHAEPPTRARAYCWAGYLALFRGDYKKAYLLLEEGLKLYRSLGDRNGIASALTYQGYAATFQGDHARLMTVLPEATALKSEINDPLALGDLNLFLSLAAATGGDVPKTLVLAEEALTQYRRLEHLDGVLKCLVNLGVVASGLGDHERARQLLNESVAMLQQLKHPLALHYTLLSLAGIATLLDQYAHAAQLWGVAERLRDTTGLYLSPLARRYANYENYIATARAQLGDDAFAKAWAKGRAMSMEQAMVYISA